MKFIVFNIVVAGALIYLVANKDTGADLSLPQLDEVTAVAERALDRATAPVDQTMATVDAPAIDAADLAVGGLTPAPEAAPVDPAPASGAPLDPVPHVEVPTRQAHVVTPPPADTVSEPAPSPAVARRRAEVLSDGPVSVPAPVPPASDRRRQLLELAEEMEYLAAEFSVQ